MLKSKLDEINEADEILGQRIAKLDKDIDGRFDTLQAEIARKANADSVAARCSTSSTTSSSAARRAQRIASLAIYVTRYTTNAWWLVFSLLNKGYLHRPPRRHRALEVTERGREFRRRVEVEHLSRRRAAAVSPAVAQTIVNIRAQLGRLRHADQAAVLASIGEA